MRILDSDSDSPLKNICIYLNRNEMAAMRDSLSDLLENETVHHVHINDEKYEREITLTLYGNDLGNFDKRSQKLIIEDK